ncbi:hypothetical protein ACFP1Z_25090 [Streptomyces gamaensis]|uniref:Uncharacterized protein n=1 Tax=Streptomyces gamaensis TaxID=1763542 RepID=A0ABW0Z8M4_9ACTN
MSDALPDWRAPYVTTAGEDNEFVTDIRSVVEGGYLTDPTLTIEMACAAAEASEAVTRALDHPWALYTPQQAATVASALFAQLSATADSLRGMQRVLGAMADRGDAGRTDDSTTAGAAPAGALADAVGHLGEAARQLEAVVTGHAHSSVHALQATPSNVTLPQDVHEAFVALAGLLGEDATLNVHHEPGAYDPDDEDGFGCGCDIDILHEGEKYNFHRGDCCWTMIRLSDGRPTKHGTVSYDIWAELPVRLATAHPHQLAQAIRDSLAA